MNHDLIIHKGTPRVSFLGNNGNLTGIGSAYRQYGGYVKGGEYDTAKEQAEDLIRQGYGIEYTNGGHLHQDKGVLETNKRNIQE